MALSIIVTVGGASTNSYVTAAEATTYLEGRLNSTAWSAAVADQNAALVEAFREINLLRFAGTKVTATQAGQWPRQWARDPDAPWYDYFALTAIPQRVKDAQCELALEFLRAGTTDVASLPSSDGIIQKTVDVLTTIWADPHSRAKGLARYPRVQQLLRPLFEAQQDATVRG